MKIVNHTNTTVRYDTNFKTAGGQNGGDCGDIPSGKDAELDYASFHDIEVFVSTVSPVSYKQVQNNAVITVTSSLNE